jgi:hypothetical protein
VVIWNRMRGSDPPRRGALIAPEPPQTPGPPPGTPRAPPVERLTKSVISGRKLVAAFTGLILAVGGVLAAVHSLWAAPGHGPTGGPPTHVSPLPNATSPSADQVPDASALSTAYHWKRVSEEAYTDASKNARIDMTSMYPGQTAWLVVVALNNGSVAWSNSGRYPINLGTYQPQDRPSRWHTSTWLSGDRPATVEPNGVLPGEVGTFEFPIVVPSGSGTFDEHFNLVADGLIWFNDTGLSFPSVVH